MAYFRPNEYNFDKIGKRDDILEKINHQLSREQNDKNSVKFQPTKTNNNFYYDNEKVLILELETDNQEIKDKLVITSSGLLNSKRRKKDNNDDDSIYFGLKEYEEESVNNIKLYILF